MQALSATERTRNLARMKNEHFDVLVIGGGITGAGVALDAVARGYNVALVEKADFASGTSSKSTKLVHGGIRYLPNFDFGLVQEALVERGLLLQNAPFLVKPLEFVLPIYEGDLHPVGMPFTTPGGLGLSFLLNMGLSLYDMMSGGRSVKWHRHLSREDVLKLAPALVQTGLKEGFTYYDAQTNDARLTLSVISTAGRYGATIANYSEVISFVEEGNKVRGAVIRDRLSGQEVTVRARHIVNATGVFAEQLEELTGTEPQVRIEPSKGSHLVFSREDVQMGDAAVVLPQTEDNRILFLVPWESRVVFGTTDTGSGDLDHPTATQDDITYLLGYLNHYMNLNLSEKDIISTYAGYRPLVKPRNTNASTAKLSRSHVVLQSSSDLVTIVGGKLTTYRRMAQDTVDVLSKRDGMKVIHPTKSMPLQGSAGWSRVRGIIEQRGAKLGLSAQSLEHLNHSYGTTAQTILDIIEQDSSLAAPLIDDLPYIKAEVIYACRYEMAIKPDDILAHRTSIVLEDRQSGAGIIDEVTALMEKELGALPQVQQVDQVQQLQQTYQAPIQSIPAKQANNTPA